MALTIEQSPVNSTDMVPVITNWTPMIGYMLYQDDISGYFFYRLVCTVEQVDADGDVVKTLGVLKQRRNGYGPDNDGATQRARAFFDLAGIVNSQLVDTVYDQNDTGAPFRTLHALGDNHSDKIFSNNGDKTEDFWQIIRVKITGSEWYSESATEIPSSQGDTVTDTLIWMAATLPLFTERDDDTDYIQGTAFYRYRMSSLTSYFLSDLFPNLQQTELGVTYIARTFVREDDYHTLGFLNDNASFGSEVKYMQITYYDTDGSIIGSNQYIENVSANGGFDPTDPGGIMEDKNRLLYFGCGPKNLEEADDVPSATSLVAPITWTDGNARPSLFPGWKYYKIVPYDGTYQTTGAPVFFFKQGDSCKGYKIRRLAWRNSLGCYDYWNFNMKSTQTIEIDRNNYSTVLGTFNKSKWRYNNTQRGKVTRKTTAILKETLQSDWMTQTDALLMEKLIVSTNVQIVANKDTEFTQGVILTDSSFIKKTRANDRLIQYTINIEYANPINTNS